MLPNATTLNLSSLHWEGERYPLCSFEQIQQNGPFICRLGPFGSRSTDLIESGPSSPLCPRTVSLSVNVSVCQQQKQPFLVHCFWSTNHSCQHSIMDTPITGAHCSLLTSLSLDGRPDCQWHYVATVWCTLQPCMLPFLLLSSTTCHFVATISVYWAANLQINQINRRCDWGDSWLLNQLTSVSWLLMHQLITATQKSEFGLDKPLLGGQHGSLTRVSVRKISQSWSVN